MSDAGGDVEDVEVGDRDITEVTYESYGDRLKDSCAGICIGFLLFFGAFPFLFWNEGRAVERYDTLQEGQTMTTSISVNSIEGTYDGRLVHFVAEITSNESNLTDPIFGVHTNDLKIHREAEIYEWEESVKTTTKTLTGGKKETKKTYSYAKAWEENHISSSGFKEQTGHENPSSMRFEDYSASQDIIYAGAFVLPEEIVSKVNWFKTLTGVNKSEIPEESLRNETTVLSSNDGFYIGNASVNSPKVGDSRVTFETVSPGIISVIAEQSGGSFMAYEAEAGGTILLFQQGNFTADEMFQQAEADNAFTTWLFRFIGFGIMAGGIYLILRPIEVFADLLPMVGDVVGCGLIYIAVTVGGVLSGITIAIAWLVHHPKIGIIILVVITAFVVGVGYCVKKAQANSANSASNRPPKPASDDPEKPDEEQEIEIDEADEEEEIKVDEAAKDQEMGFSAALDKP